MISVRTVRREIYGARYDNTLTTLNTLPATDTVTTSSLQSQSSVIPLIRNHQMNYVIASYGITVLINSKHKILIKNVFLGALLYAYKPSTR